MSYSMGFAKKQEQEMIIELFFARKCVFIFYGFPKTLDCNLLGCRCFWRRPHCSSCPLKLPSWKFLRCLEKGNDYYTYGAWAGLASPILLISSSLFNLWWAGLFFSSTGFSRLEEILKSMQPEINVCYLLFCIHVVYSLGNNIILPCRTNVFCDSVQCCE